MRNWMLAAACVMSTLALGCSRAPPPPAQSALPAEPDRGSPDRGSPDRGSPDRSSPDRGSPDRGSPDR